MEDADKKYYSIGEAAEIVGVTTSLLRYWEKMFKKIQPQKSTRGIRKYTVADINKLKYIYRLLKKEGYTIKGANVFLERKSSSLPVVFLESKSSSLPVQNNAETPYKILIKNLKEMRNFLEDLQNLSEL